MTPTLPTGTVTFLFTDIEGSTPLWEREPKQMHVALERHHVILQESVAACGGHVYKIIGDAFQAAFEVSSPAIQAALAAQRALAAEVWPTSTPLRVRMGLHVGHAKVRGDDYATTHTLNRVARIMSAAHGGQILLSEAVAELIRDDLPEAVSLRDMGHHHLKGLTQPEHLFQVVVPDLPQSFPPLQSVATQRSNLPTQLTSFIGRESELSETAKLLEDTHLLTMIGPGGTGKTRLSLRLADRLLPSFKDGVWFVELAPLTDPALILQTVATVFDLRAQLGTSIKEVIVNYLRSKNLLLILDNCEHLVEACAQIVNELLHEAPHMKIVASSREAFGIYGETVYRVPSLKLPNPAQVTREALLECESAQLFVERARAANPKFELTDANASFIAQICTRLDGIPLALELAAARVTIFSPETIAARLNDRFKLLTGGSRTALPRQQTLRALIDWSYDLLTEEERALLRRLSVFAGGWTFEATEAVCPELDVLSLLSQLINKSLATMEEQAITRYRLLETIRQYAYDKLREAGELETVHDLHAGYFLQLAETAETKLYTVEALRWTELLEADLDNLRTALEWFLTRNVESALKIISALALFWSGRGHQEEGRVWSEAALARAESLPPAQGEAALQRTRLMANALGALVAMVVSQGDILYAQSVAEKCATLARESGDKALLALILCHVCAGLLITGDAPSAETMLAEALSAARESGNTFALGWALGLTAQSLMILNRDPVTMQAYSKESTALLKTSGNHWALSQTLIGIGMSARYTGRFDEAREQFAIVEPIVEGIGDSHRHNIIRSEYAHMDRYEGRLEEAEGLYRETILEWHRLGHRAAIAHQLESLAFIAIARGRLERAARLLGAAEALRERINIAMSSLERVEYEKEVAKLRAGTSEAQFATRWNNGRVMTMEQAIRFALDS
jgi:predicted ATPase/class 3 adenylate cyclase